jgi:hypothetical protein
MRRILLNGSFASSSSSVGKRSFSGRVFAYSCVTLSTAWVLVRAHDVARDTGVSSLAQGVLRSKWARRIEEKRSPTPEKYPGMRGTVCAWTVGEAEGCVEEQMQRREGEEGDGLIVGGRMAASHGLNGMEEMTTLGTWYSSWRICKARLRDARSLSSTWVRVLWGEG